MRLNRGVIFVLLVYYYKLSLTIYNLGKKIRWRDLSYKRGLLYKVLTFYEVPIDNKLPQENI